MHKDKKNRDEALANIDELEITPLSDEELNAVAGGITDKTTAESCSCCAATATNHDAA
jgi:hypothetical protein